MFLIYIFNWELETEQRFTCLEYPEERRVAAALCAFTSFSCVWWSEHRRLYRNNIPTTWAALKTAMHTRWVPPYYQCELLQKLQRLRQGKILRRILSGITNWYDFVWYH